MYDGGESRLENGNMSIREGKGHELDGSDGDGWEEEEERIYANRGRGRERWNGGALV